MTTADIEAYVQSVLNLVMVKVQKSGCRSEGRLNDEREVSHEVRFCSHLLQQVKMTTCLAIAEAKLEDEKKSVTK